MDGTNVVIEVKSNVQEFQRLSEEAKMYAAEIIGMRAERYAKLDCPVGTPESTGIVGYIGGTLRNSITHYYERDEGAVYIGTNVEYAPYQELGTVKMQAANHGKGFLRPAASEHTEEYKQVIKDAYGKH